MRGKYLVPTAGLCNACMHPWVNHDRASAEVGVHFCHTCNDLSSAVRAPGNRPRTGDFY